MKAKKTIPEFYVHCEKIVNNLKNKAYGTQ